MLEAVRYGPQALLLRFAETVGEPAFQQGRAIVAELERRPPAGLVECVPGFTTILLRFDSSQTGNLPWLGRYITDQLAHVSGEQLPTGPVKTIPVIYDGEDLEALAQEKGLSITDVIQLHCAPVYKVYLLGFSPGFPYLGELHPRLHTSRRPTPRSRVAAGSVAIGGEHTGIYSVDSPGGWRVIGRTNVPMFQTERLSATSRPDEVFLLRAGDRVRFEPLGIDRP